MKKLWILLIVLGMLFSFAMVVSAATENQGVWTVYGDLGVYGASNNTVNSSTTVPNADEDYDGTSGYLLGVEYDWGPFLAVAEYTGNTFEKKSSNPAASDYRSNTMLIRGGYYFINNEKIKVNGVLGYMQLDVINKDSNAKKMDLTNGGTLIGIDGTYVFSDKFSLNASYGLTVGADCSVELLDDILPAGIKQATTQSPSVSKSSSLNTYRVKGIYQWTDHISTYLSYSFLESKLKYSYKVPGVYSGKVDVDSTWYGWAVGMIYKF